jgi:hypothetical protein
LLEKFQEIEVNIVKFIYLANGISKRYAGIAKTSRKINEILI